MITLFAYFIYAAPGKGNCLSCELHLQVGEMLQWRVEKGRGDHGFLVKKNISEMCAKGVWN